MERVYSLVINIFLLRKSIFIKVVNYVWNTAEYSTTFIEWDLRNL